MHCPACRARFSSPFSGLALVVILVPLLLACGCGKRGQRIVIRELGFSMTLPERWRSSGLEAKDRTDRALQADFSDPTRADNWGSVVVSPMIIEDLDGKSIKPQSVAEYAELLIAQVQKMENLQQRMAQALGKVVGQDTGEAALAGSRIVSRGPRNVCGRQAFEVITEADYMLYEVFIPRNDEVITVSFRTVKEDFPKYEEAFRKAIDSIKME